MVDIAILNLKRGMGVFLLVFLCVCVLRPSNGTMKLKGQEVFVMSTNQEERMHVSIGVRERNNNNNR